MSRHHADEVVETLSERLGFLQVDERVRQDLRLVRPMIERHLARSLDRFYDVVRRTPQVALQEIRHVRSLHFALREAFWPHFAKDSSLST